MGACIAPTPPRKRWQGHAHGRFTPVLKKALLGNGRLRRSTARRVLRCFPRAPQILQRALIADAMALRAPRCRLCAFAGASAAPAPRGGRATPTGGSAAALPVCFSLSPRVAPSCTLLRTGTSPCSVSVRWHADTVRVLSAPLRFVSEGSLQGLSVLRARVLFGRVSR